MKHHFSSIRRLGTGATALTGWLSDRSSRLRPAARQSRPTAEQELRLRSEQFEALLNAAPIGLYLIDADFRIRHVNPVARRVFGADTDELIGRDFADVVRSMWNPERAGDIAQIFRLTLETGESYHEPELSEQRADRDVTDYYDWRTQRIVLPDGRFGVACYFRDVSDQVSARKRIAESELRYRMLFESINAGLCIVELIFDDAEKAADCRFVVTNPAFETHTGIVNARGRTIRELVPDIAQVWIELCASVALTGEHERFVDHSRSMDRWFEVDAFRTGSPEQRRVALLFSDVTERKQADQALRESEQRFRIMADSAPALIWVSDTTGGCTYFNRQWLEFTGRTLEEELGEGWTEAVHPDDRQRTIETYRSSSARREPVRMEFRLRRHDGVYRWLVEEGVPRHLPDGQFAGYVGVCVDITERMQWERALRETDRRKDEFLSTLSHELRNPLAAVSTATSVLRNSHDDADRVGEMAAIIERQSSQLVRLIDDLLDVSRISRGKVKLERQHVDIVTIVGHVIADCTACEEKGLELVSEIPERPLLIDADPVRIGQVVNNLLDNACKFTPSGGQVRVAVRQEGGDAVIAVADNGIGMAREQLPRIFDMFAQVEESPGDRTGGLGIGLSLAKSIIDLHGGTIEAHSEGPEQGSEFTLRLRLSDSDAPGVDVVEEQLRGGPQQQTSKRIVAADDNLDTLRAVALLLRMKGHDVETAVDGADALGKVQAHLPDVALLDIGMPGMDGYEVARRIRREPWGQHVLLVATTGWGAQRDKQQAKEAGFDAHLTKPVNLDALERLIAAPQQDTADQPDVPLH